MIQNHQNMLTVVFKLMDLGKFHHTGHGALLNVKHSLHQLLFRLTDNILRTYCIQLTKMQRMIIIEFLYSS